MLLKRTPAPRLRPSMTKSKAPCGLRSAALRAVACPSGRCRRHLLAKLIGRNGSPQFIKGPAALAHSRTTVCVGIEFPWPRWPTRTRFAHGGLSPGTRGPRPAEDAITRRRGARLVVFRPRLSDLESWTAGQSLARSRPDTLGPMVSA